MVNRTWQWHPKAGVTSNLPDLIKIPKTTLVQCSLIDDDFASVSSDEMHSRVIVSPINDNYIHGAK